MEPRHYELEPEEELFDCDYEDEQEWAYVTAMEERWELEHDGE